MTEKYRQFIAETGATILQVISRPKRKGVLAYIVEYEGKEYRWAVSTLDRGIKPWEFTKRPPRRYRYKNKWVLYRMYDEANTLLYIGKTKQLDYRLYAHFVKTREVWKDEVIKIDASVFDNEADMHIYEMYLITKDQPIYNRHAACSVLPTVTLPDIMFEEVTDWD